MRLKQIVCIGILTAWMGAGINAPAHAFDWSSLNPWADAPSETPVDPPTASAAPDEPLPQEFPPVDLEAQSAGPFIRSANDHDPLPGDPMGTTTVTVKSGDTLMSILTNAGAGRRDAYNAIESMRAAFDPRHLRPGHELTLTFEAERTTDNLIDSALAGIEITPSIEKTIRVERTDDGSYGTETVEQPVIPVMEVGRGVIRSSLYTAAEEAGVPIRVMMNMMRPYAYDVDFQRDIQPGDAFEILYERHILPDGTVVRDGDFLYAKLTLRGKEKPIYRYEGSDGVVDFFGLDGQSVRRSLMRTPIDGARISSGYGNRRHPILGYNKMHKGIDFAAPTGTPIYAAGDGVVDRIGRLGGYGKYIRIRHNGKLSTAYAHLNAYARGLKKGSRVDQGQVIGYVGSTGRSTGPHLHYEVLINGSQVNPLSINVPTGRVLEGHARKAFQFYASQLDQTFDALLGPEDHQIADASPQDDTETINSDASLTGAACTGTKIVTDFC